MNTEAAGPAAAPAAGEAHHPPVNLMIVVAVVLCAVLEVLDSTIVNVALPHIESSFGATNDQITWVLTSYIVSAVVVMPLTGLMAQLIGRKRLILMSIIGFAVFSALCGLAQSLDMMVLFRLGQGMFGAFLIPLSQSILFDAFPREKRGQAMAMFGLGVIVAPVLGPTIGAYLTDTFSWRMVFYVNIPIAALALIMMTGELPDDEPKRVKIDWTGLVLLMLAIGALQFMLDQGQTLDWFSSRIIQSAAFVSGMSFLAFLTRGIGKADNIIDLGLFADRNYMLASLVIACFAVAMFGGIALLPLFVQGLLGYPVMLAGHLFIPRGLAAGFSMVFTGAVLVSRFDARLLAGVGLALTAWSNWMIAVLPVEVTFWDLAWPGVVAGFGMGLIFVPLSTLAFDSIPRARQDEASGLYAVTRQLGSSIGIAAVAAALSRSIAVNHSHLVEHVTPYAEAARAFLVPLGLSPENPRGAALIAQQVQMQAAHLAYVQVFAVLTAIPLAVIPLLLFMHKPSHGRGMPAGH